MFRNHSLIGLGLISIMLLIPVIACDEPAAAPVTPAVTTPASPRLGVSPLTIDVVVKYGQSDTLEKIINVANEGGGVMLWAARERVEWMWMNEQDGALEKSYSKKVNLFISPSGLDVGTYTDNVTIEAVGSRNSPQSVLVTLTIKPADAPVTDTGSVVVKNPVPPPPWEYNEYTNDTYHFRLRYPKDYNAKQILGAAFSAVPASKEQTDIILLNINSAYGVDYKSVATEMAKSAMKADGASRTNVKVIADDNTTTLADGVSRAYEMLFESKSSGSQSYQCYLFGTQKGTRFIFFLGCDTLTNAADRLDLWKQIGHTLEFTN